MCVCLCVIFRSSVFHSHPSSVYLPQRHNKIKPSNLLDMFWPILHLLSFLYHSCFSSFLTLAFPILSVPTGFKSCFFFFSRPDCFQIFYARHFVKSKIMCACVLLMISTCIPLFPLHPLTFSPTDVKWEIFQTSSTFLHF